MRTGAKVHVERHAWHCGGLAWEALEGNSVQPKSVSRGLSVTLKTPCAHAGAHLPGQYIRHGAGALTTGRFVTWLAAKPSHAFAGDGSGDVPAGMLGKKFNAEKFPNRSRVEDAASAWRISPYLGPWISACGAATYSACSSTK